MIENSEYLQEQNKKLDNIITEISAMISENSIIPESFSISLHELTDGFTTSSSMLSELFINTAGKEKSCGFVQFNSMPVTNSLENFSKPLILIADEQELDATTCDIVRKRSENGYITFPVIIFSDNFFNLTYGESCSYITVIGTFEDASKEKVMVFRKSDFRYIDSYLLYIANLSKIYICVSALEELNQYLCDMIKADISEIEQSRDSISALILINQVKAIQQLCVDTERLSERLKSQTDVWNAEILKLRDLCDKEAFESIMHIKADKLSPFVLNIDLKYGKLQEYIHNFINSDIMKRKRYGFLTDELKELIQNTQSAIEHNTAKLSLIGTFSSGKTTLINTFLGKRDVPLRTSMGHNTAVLMHLFYEPFEREYYDIIYKEKLVWTVVKPASMEKAVVNKEDSKIRIINVESQLSGNYLIRYSVLKTKKTQSLKIRASSGIIVKKGDILNPGDPFAKKSQKLSNNIEICSKGELHLIIKLISNSSDFAMKSMEGNSEYSKDRIVDILKRVSKIAKEKNSTVSYETFCMEIGLKPTINEISKKEEYSGKYRRIEVECNLNLSTKRKRLDKKGWLELCGNPEQSENDNIEIFSEKPECYMLAKELQLHVHAEFLQYCSLTDTPGFGSVTEEHDAITERYIRDSTGRLLVMIAVNAKTFDAKYQDLVNSIDDIYNNFRGADKKNVVFILNCFTHLSKKESIKKHIKDVSDMLIKYGFNRNNIFVCNLKAALTEKQQTETMMGFPSYKKFHDFIIQEMISSDLTRKYRGIKSEWKIFFNDGKNRTDNQIYELEQAINNVQSYKHKIQDEINQVRNVNIQGESYTDMLEIFQDALESLIDAYENNRKGIFNTPRWDAICSALSNINESVSAQNKETIEEIQDYYRSCINKISLYGNSEITPPDLPARNVPVVVLDSESLKSLMSEADNETHWYNKSSKFAIYSEKIEKNINSGLSQSRDKAQNYSDECYDVVCKFRNQIINEKNFVLRNIQSEADMHRALQELNELKLNIQELEKSFNQIVFV